MTALVKEFKEKAVLLKAFPSKGATLSAARSLVGK